MSSAETVTIRPCTLDDLDAVVALLANDLLGAGREAAGADLASYRQAFAEIEADPRNTVYVAEQGGQVVGCYQLSIIPNLTFEGGWRAQIEGVRVCADARGAGVGEQLMRHAIAIAGQEKCRLVQLTSNRTRDGALRFYERHGFEPTHVGFKLYL